METKKPGTDIVLYQQPLQLQEADHGPQAPPSDEFIEVDVRELPLRELPLGDGGDSHEPREPQEPPQEPRHDNEGSGSNESASERHLRDIAAGLAFLVGAKMREERAAAAEPIIADPVPGDEPSAPEPQDMSDIKDGIGRVGDLLQDILVQNTPPPRPPRPPSYLSLTGAELDARKDPSPELTAALGRLSETESTMSRLDIGQDNENPYPGQASYYDTKLSVESQAYVDTLLSDAVQDNVGEVTIGLQGMRLIKRSLEGDIPPTPEDLARLSRVVEQQISHNQVSPDNPLVNEITDMLKIENWQLSYDEVDQLEGILTLDKVVPKITLDPPKQSIYERFKRGSSRYVKAEKVPNMSRAGTLSQRVDAWWSHSNERHREPKAVTMGSRTAQVKHDRKLNLAKEDAQRRLALHYAALAAVRS